MKKPTLLALFGLLTVLIARSQPCTPAGDPTVYGTGNVWRGYVYDNLNFSNYSGYVTEGNAGSPNFDQSFGGDDVYYPTNGCPVFTSTYSVRYRLNKTFSSGFYDFIVGADDGYRLSLDGGATWVIDRWTDQGYNTTGYSTMLNGNYDMVLEFYENGGGNRVSFAVNLGCMGSEDPTVYGSSDIWRGYVYDGTSFNSYRGMVQEGSLGVISFDQNFGGDNTFYPTSACSVQTETFSVRYRLRKNFTFGSYTFIAGGDDGYRLSLDGGATWVIDRWFDQSFGSSSFTGNLSGWHNLVLEYYENGGGNRVYFEMQSNLILKINLLSFTGKKEQGQVALHWTASADSDPVSFDVEKSTDGLAFNSIQTIAGSTGVLSNNVLSYKAIDPSAADRNFYRLKMKDASGVISYSPIILVSGAINPGNELQLFPTVTSNGRFYIKAGKALQQATVIISDISGRVLDRQSISNLAAAQVVQISMGNNPLPAGLYLVTVLEAGEKLKTERIIVP